MRRGLALRVAAVAALAWPGTATADRVPHDAVQGDDANVTLPDGTPVDWAALSTTRRGAATATFVIATPAGAEAIEIPACAGTSTVAVDAGAAHAIARRPVVIDLPHDGADHAVTLRVTFSSYESHVACSGAPRVGRRVTSTEGLGLFTFASAHARGGGGEAVVYIPKDHDPTRPATLLVGLHPWSGSTWTYAAYRELLREADAKDVVLLLPSGLGNSLYTDAAEDEVMTALDALGRDIAIDPRRVSLWGASMGGAGATTIGFHHPDRFASVTSFFGDSRYDLGTYVKAILHDEAGAHKVNALDVADNARNVPVWLVHGEDDHVSPIAQSAVLDAELRRLGLAVRFDRVPGMGHEGALVARFLARVVDLAAEARAPEAPRRVSFTSVTGRDASVYGIRLLRSGARGDASIDLERRGDTIHVLRALRVRAIVLPRGAFGVAPSATPPVVFDDPGARGVDVRWDPAP